MFQYEGIIGVYKGSEKYLNIFEKLTTFLLYHDRCWLSIIGLRRCFRLALPTFSGNNDGLRASLAEESNFGIETSLVVFMSFSNTHSSGTLEAK